MFTKWFVVNNKKIRYALLMCRRSKCRTESRWEIFRPFIVRQQFTLDTALARHLLSTHHPLVYPASTSVLCLDKSILFYLSFDRGPLVINLTVVIGISPSIKVALTLRIRYLLRIAARRELDHTDTLCGSLVGIICILRVCFHTTPINNSQIPRTSAVLWMCSPI